MTFDGLSLLALIIFDDLPLLAVAAIASASVLLRPSARRSSGRSTRIGRAH